jgi:hypothetical protein
MGIVQVTMLLDFANVQDQNIDCAYKTPEIVFEKNGLGT